MEYRRAELVRGLPVVGLADTWLDLCAVLDQTDLVVLGDAIVG